MKGLPNIPDLVSVDTPDGRIYTAPDKSQYYSVTTFLSYFPNLGIEAWKEEVGEKVANEISTAAKNRGNHYHRMVENYLKSTSDRKTFLSEINLIDKQMFLDSEKSLNRINNIHFIEKTLFSPRMRLAGRVDVIAEFDGKLSIIDNKTSSREKQADEIESYFLQTTAYSIMYEELTGRSIEQIVIIMLCDDRPTTKVFIRNPRRYHDILFGKLAQFHNRK